VSWTSSRDRQAEFTALLAMVGGTLARIGNEVYQLQRPEIGELREPTRPGAVGSITMPHKRNPESAEHLVTLWRLVRAAAGTSLESMVQEHERDGRGWKAEWVAFPEASLLAATALDLTRRLLEGLEVDEARMAANALADGGMASSEALLVALAPRVGKHRAQDLLQELLEEARRHGRSLAEAAATSEVARQLPEDELRSLLERPATGAAGAMVDEVVRRARERRAGEPETWP
jgi:adenylosuccinate lyase